MDRSRAELKAARLAAEQQTMSALRSGEFAQAALIRVTLGTQVGSGGNAVWNESDMPNLVESCREIFQHCPTILAGMPDATLFELKVAAAMGWLWGSCYERDVKRWLPRDLQTGLIASNEAAVRMIASAVGHRRQVASAASLASVRGLKLTGVPDNRCCEACRALQGRLFLPCDAPELPHPNCTSPIGCRCGFVLITHRRWERYHGAGSALADENG